MKINSKKLLTFKLFLAFSGACALSAADSSLKLSYDRPGMEWIEYLPIGNGRLGGMISGMTEMEHVQLSDITLWSGRPFPADQIAGPSPTAQYFKEGRELFEAGQIDALRYGDTLVKLDMQPGQELRFNGDFVQQ